MRKWLTFVLTAMQQVETVLCKPQTKIVGAFDLKRVICPYRYEQQILLPLRAIGPVQPELAILVANRNGSIVASEGLQVAR